MNETTRESAPSAVRSPAPAWRIRPAGLMDVDAIFALIHEASRTTTVLPRAQVDLCEHIRDFVVAESAGAIVGCGALNLSIDALAEVKSLVVAGDWRGRGLGGRLVEALVTEARRLGVRRVFALTDRVDFFSRLGFAPTDKETLPHKVWTECIRCPKYHCCEEEALDLRLDEAPAAAPRSHASGGAS